jgi:predicted nucleotidyltransferase component of viral defense system
MDRRTHYHRQVQLLLRVLPYVARYPCFALKGGTAINLFVRDLPRLSVDIDLVFLPMSERDEALAEIRSCLDDLAERIQHGIPGSRIVKSFRDREDALRLVVSDVNAQIKIELSPVLRGTVFQPAVIPVTERVEERFGYAEIQVVHFADLYAGKICAALDRQHPRDLFDIRKLLDTEGIDHSLRKALIVYIISHNRPISELLRPNFKDISGLYEGEFRSMSQEDVPLAELEKTRERLVALVNSSLTSEERQFLLTFKRCDPEWALLGLTGVETLPAVKWKLRNLKKMNPEAYSRSLNELRRVLQS